MKRVQHSGYRLTPCCKLCLHSEYFGWDDWGDTGLLCMLGVALEKDAPLTEEYYVCDHFTAPNEKTARALAEIGKKE